MSDERRDEGLEESEEPKQSRAAAAAAALNAAFPPTEVENTSIFDRLREHRIGRLELQLETVRGQLATIERQLSEIRKQSTVANPRGKQRRERMVAEITAAVVRSLGGVGAESNQVQGRLAALEQALERLVAELEREAIVSAIFRKNPLMEKLRGEAKKPDSEPDRG